MPLYEYICNTCGNGFEMLESMHQNKHRTCNVCGGVAERIISSSILKFKGTGFHITDYGRYGRKNKENI